MEESKIAPLGVLVGGAVAFGIMIYGQSAFTTPGLAWLLKPFLWIFIPIAIIAITAGVILAALIAARHAIMDTSTTVGMPAGMYASIVFIFQSQVNFKSIILSLLIGSIVYGFYSYLLAAMVGTQKYRNQ